MRGLNKAPRSDNKGSSVQDTTEQNRAAKRSGNKAPKAAKRTDANKQSKTPIIKKKAGSTIKNTVTDEAVKKKDSNEKTKAPITKKKVGSTIMNMGTVEAIKKKDTDKKTNSPIRRKTILKKRTTVTAKEDSILKSKMPEASRCYVEIHRLRSIELEFSGIYAFPSYI